MKYTTSFKKAVLRKVLPPENRSIHSVSVELGVGEMTIHRWIAQAERFHSTLKTEHVRQTAYFSYEDAKEKMAQ